MDWKLLNKVVHDLGDMIGYASIKRDPYLISKLTEIKENLFLIIERED